MEEDNKVEVNNPIDDLDENKTLGPIENKEPILQSAEERFVESQTVHTNEPVPEIHPTESPEPVVEPEPVVYSEPTVDTTPVEYTEIQEEKKEEVQPIENTMPVSEIGPVEQDEHKEENNNEVEIKEEKVETVVENTNIINKDQYAIDDDGDDVVEPEKKKKKSILLPIIALLIIAALVVVFIFFNPFKSKRKEYAPDDPMIQKLINPFLYNGDHCFMSGSKLNTDNRVRLRVAYESLKVDDKETISCDEVGGLLTYKDDDGVEKLNAYCGGSPSQEMYDAYSSGDMVAFEEAANNNETDFISAAKFKEHFYKVFDSKYSYEDESFGMGSTEDAVCILMSYNQYKKGYALYSGQCENTCLTVGHDVTSAYEENGTLYVYTEYRETIDNTIRVVYEFKKDGENYRFVKVSEEMDVE